MAEGSLPRGKLVCLTGATAGHVYLLPRERTILGRAPQCDIALDDPFASRQHAAILWEQGRYRLVDLGSKNGVFVDGQRVTEAWLEEGQVIQVGQTQFRFHDPAATMTQPMAGATATQPGLWVDPERREVWIDGEQVTPPLSPTQFKLLLLLWRHRGRCVSKDEIAQEVWDACAGEVSDGSIDRMISRLRARLGDTSHPPRFIQTLRGHGYRLDPR
ncbi:MAG: winged helix-turn-helix domain-containing protein [Anaerolineae bacterium]